MMLAGYLMVIPLVNSCFCDKGFCILVRIFLSFKNVFINFVIFLFMLVCSKGKFFVMYLDAKSYAFSKSKNVKCEI